VPTIGVIVTPAEADLAKSPALVAVTVTVLGDGTATGAVKSPLLFIVPQVAPLQLVPDTVQATAVFEVPVTEAANCCVNPAATDVLAGETVTTTAGTMVTLADADLVGSATLVTITLTAAAGEGATVGAE
jgi:hypothetical protein